jgi:hypothetical protein
LSLGAAAPLAAVVVAVVKQFEVELRSAQDENITQLVDEPLNTAVTTLDDILGMRHETPVERKECERLLESVADDLRKAYSHAGNKSEDQFRIRILQAFVAALREGGGAFLRLRVGEFRRYAIECRAMALQRQQEAEGIEKLWADSSREPRDLAMRSEARRVRIMAFKHIESLKQQAEQLRDSAHGLEGYCNFLTTVSTHKQLLLED